MSDSTSYREVIKYVGWASCCELPVQSSDPDPDPDPELSPPNWIFWAYG
jgi:hypothetical protein